MKAFKKTFVATALVLTTGYASATVPDTVSWALWNGTTGTLTQNSNNITVTYSGDYVNGDQNPGIFNAVPSSFTSLPLVTNTPGANGTIDMVGGNATINDFHFSQAVIDPIVALWSVGQNGTPVTFNFQNGTFSIISQGAGYWGGGSLVQSGNTVTGLEGNGLLQFKGTYSDLYFTTPNYENYYGATVGAAIAAVPEPETYAMLLMGLGLLGFMALKKKSATAA